MEQAGIYFYSIIIVLYLESIFILGFTRTQGDGMEFKFSPEKIEYKNDHNSPEDKKIHLVPGSLIRLNRSVYNNYKKKEPKLVLYEPYKAAVKPIVPKNHKNIISLEKKKRKNLDCNELVSQILLMSNNEINLQKGIPMTCVKPIAKTKDKPLETLKSDNDKQNLLSEVCFLNNTKKNIYDTKFFLFTDRLPTR